MRGRRSIGGRQRPGLVGTAARTAVVAGTATATVGAVSHAMGGGEQASATPAPTSATPAEQLKQLAELRDSGVLTDAEFEAEKQRILTS